MPQNMNAIISPDSDCALLRQRILELEQERDQARAESQQLLDLFMHTSIPACLWRGPEYIYEMANHAYLSLVGRDILGKPVCEAVPELATQGHLDMLDRVYTSGEPVTVNELLIRYDRHGTGQVQDAWFNVMYHPVRAIDGTVTGILHLALDVTAQVLARRAVESRNAEIEQLNIKLQHSQSLLKGLVDHIPAGVFIKDLEGHFLLINQFAAAMTGHTASELIGKTEYDLLPPDIVRGIHARDQRMVATGTPLTNEEIIPLDDGSHVFLSIRFPIYNAQGQIYATGGIGIDITAHRQTQHKLELMHIILDRTMDMVALITIDGRFSYVNKALSQALGYRTTELLTLGAAVISPEWLADDWTATWNDIKNKNFITFETHYRHQSGSTFPVEITANHITFNDQEYVCTFARDIRQRKAVEESLRASEAKNRVLIEAIPDMMFIQDRQGTYLDYIESHHQPYVSPEEFIGKRVGDIFPPELARPFITIIEQALDTGSSQFIEYALPPHPGHESGGNFEARVSPISHDTVLVLVRDITSRKQAEAERAALQQQIIDLQRSALRELSTPLIPITDDVLIMPLIGVLDSYRIQQVMETLLDGVARHRAKMVILDITGVKLVDTQIANAFIQTSQMVRLLGAQVMLTGMNPEAAQTIVHLGVDMTGIMTFGSLQSGITAALQRR